MEQILDTTRSVQRAAPAVWRWTLALAALFLFRLLFGLCFEFFFEDETQIFLIGLRAYAYRTWPWFGPDIVWTHSQIPGALQGLLVALPLYVAPFPEAPFVLLNAISFGALALLAWYIVRRLPALPRWLVWGWVMTCPWTINFSTSLINTSYILPGAVLFFAGFFESYPRLAIGAIPRRLALAMMGFGVTWVMQVHMSWPLLGPYLAAVFIARRRDGWRTLAGDAAVVAAGAAIPAVLLVPTFVRYGLHAGTGGTARNVTMHWVGFEAMISTVARFLSFASLEVAQFIGTDTAKRVMFALEHLWIVPLLAIVWVAGLAQPVWMAWTWFARRHPARAEWPAVKTLVLATVLLIAAAYCFASVPPQAHAFYAVAPIAFVYAAYCFAGIDSPRWRRVAAALLAVNIAFQLGVAFILGPTRSLYLHRDVVAAAVSRRDPDLLAHRRAFAMDARPEDADPRRDPRDELTLAEPEWSLHPVRAVVWHVTVRNDSTTRAYRDLLYQAVYRDASGNVLDTRHGLVRDVFEPGEPRRVEINDGSVRVPFASATIEVILAEALKPLR